MPVGGPSSPIPGVTRRLFAVCHETWLPGRTAWKPGITYVHAESPGEAMLSYGNSIPKSVVLRIVGAAPPVGVFVEERKGGIEVSY